MPLGTTTTLHWTPPKTLGAHDHSRSGRRPEAACPTAALCCPRRHRALGHVRPPRIPETGARLRETHGHPPPDTGGGPRDTVPQTTTAMPAATSASPPDDTSHPQGARRRSPPEARPPALRTITDPPHRVDDRRRSSRSQANPGRSRLAWPLSAARVHRKPRACRGERTGAAARGAQVRSARGLCQPPPRHVERGALPDAVRADRLERRSTRAPPFHVKRRTGPRRSSSGRPPLCSRR
jgi:hypothetical protein